MSIRENLTSPRGHARTGFLGGEEWATLTDFYSSLEYDVETLLWLAIIYHDIGKYIHRHDHAAKSGRLIGDLSPDELISQNDLLNERPWRDEPLELDEAAGFLKQLVEFHEVYGNYTTGEQSLLGFEPIIQQVPAKHLERFLDVLLILAALDVAGTGPEGFLYKIKVRQYQRAREDVLGCRSADVRPSLSALASQQSEIVERVTALAYSYGSRDFYDRYEDHLREVGIAFGDEMALLCRGGIQSPNETRDQFFGALARIRKMAYALRNFGELTGVPPSPPTWPPSTTVL